jgi:glycine cleavage system aminomethyltransferase T
VLYYRVFGAVLLVTEQMGLRRDKYSAFPRDQGKILRDDLVAAIDNELAMLTAAAVDAAAIPKWYDATIYESTSFPRFREIVQSPVRSIHQL